MEEILFPELCEECKTNCEYPDELTFLGSSCVYPVQRGIFKSIYLCSECYKKCIPYREYVRSSKLIVLPKNFMDRYYRIKEVQEILHCKIRDINRVEHEGLLTVRLHPHNNFKLYYKDQVNSLLERVFE